MKKVPRYSSCKKRRKRNQRWILTPSDNTLSRKFTFLYSNDRSRCQYTTDPPHDIDAATTPPNSDIRRAGITSFITAQPQFEDVRLCPPLPQSRRYFLQHQPLSFPDPPTTATMHILPQCRSQPPLDNTYETATQPPRPCPHSGELNNSTANDQLSPTKPSYHSAFLSDKRKRNCDR
ncbi:hypothetical protein RYX36_025287 [Vicia faba]